MAVGRRLNPGEEGLWPSSGESQDRINELAAKSHAARQRSRSPEMRAFLTDVAGLPPDESMTRVPKHADPLPAGGVSTDVVQAARVLARNPQAAATEARIRWEEQVRSDERRKLDHPEEEPFQDWLDMDDEPEAEALPEDTPWNHGPAAFGEEEDPLAGFNVSDSEGESFEQWQYRERQEALRQTYEQQGQTPPSEVAESDDGSQADMAQAEFTADDFGPPSS